MYVGLKKLLRKIILLVAFQSPKEIASEAMLTIVFSFYSITVYCHQTDYELIVDKIVL